MANSIDYCFKREYNRDLLDRGDIMFYVMTISTNLRKAGPYVTKLQAYEAQDTFPNPNSLCVAHAKMDTIVYHSKFARVGQTIRWRTGLQTQEGTVSFIHRDLPTASEKVNADFYIVRTEKTTVSLNSNAMEHLEVENLSTGICFAEMVA